MDSIEKQKEDIFKSLKNFIAEVVGEDVAEELNIEPESVFTRDLEMDSIEIVSFAEKVKAAYGDNIDFNGWLSGMEMEQLINLSINDVVNYIVDANSSNK